jgi:hypothetical protein
MKIFGRMFVWRALLLESDGNEDIIFGKTIPRFDKLECHPICFQDILYHCWFSMLNFCDSLCPYGFFCHIFREINHILEKSIANLQVSKVKFTCPVFTSPTVRNVTIIVLRNILKPSNEKVPYFCIKHRKNICCSEVMKSAIVLATPILLERFITKHNKIFKFSTLNNFNVTYVSSMFQHKKIRNIEIGLANQTQNTSNFFIKS